MSHLCYPLSQEHAFFPSLRFVELSALLLDLKSPVDIASLKSRFACIHILTVHALKVKNDFFKEMVKLFKLRLFQR
jgi:hypothetical protein